MTYSNASKWADEHISKDDFIVFIFCTYSEHLIKKKYNIKIINKK